MSLIIIHGTCTCTRATFSVDIWYILLLGPTLKMGFFFLGSTSGLYLIGWRAANMSSMSSGEECNVKCALLVQLGSMDCLLERSYHIHTPAADTHWFLLSILAWVAFRQQSLHLVLSGSVILFAVHSNYARENLSLRRCSREPSQVSGVPSKELLCEVEATNLRTHFKEYPEVFQNSWLYLPSWCWWHIPWTYIQEQKEIL